MCIEEKSIAYVLGELSPAEREGIDRERLYNRDLDREIRRFELIMADLGVNAAEARASETLWSRIADAVARERSDLAGKVTGDCIDGDWQVHGPGIEFKLLWSPKAMLIRCVPGAFEDAHLQPDDDDEHIVVLAGDLQIGGRCFGTGGYICVPAGSQHVQMSTSGGCILFTEYAPRAEPVSAFA